MAYDAQNTFDDNWEAWRNVMPGANHSIMVTGTCEFPTSGYVPLLRRAEPQGINPNILELELVVVEPLGPVLEIISHERATYFEETDVEYDQVHIRPDGPTLNVQIAT